MINNFKISAVVLTLMLGTYVQAEVHHETFSSSYETSQTRNGNETVTKTVQTTIKNGVKKTTTKITKKDINGNSKQNIEIKEEKKPENDTEKDQTNELHAHAPKNTEPSCTLETCGCHEEEDSEAESDKDCDMTESGYNNSADKSTNAAIQNSHLSEKTHQRSQEKHSSLKKEIANMLHFLGSVVR